MAAYSFSALADGQAISFDPNSDVVFFDDALISAADVSVISEGANTRLRVIHGAQDGKDILLLNTVAAQLATSNVDFANGSLLLIGDDSPAQNDASGNALTGTAGSDFFHGLGGNDTLDGGTGNDRLFGGEGSDSVLGGAGDDALNGGAGIDTLNGGDGDDVYAPTAGDVLIDSGGVDTIVTDITWTLAAGFENLIQTGTAAISAYGNSLNNVIAGNDGNNYVQGGDGSDSILGGAGRDTIGGNGGTDWVGGGAGNDTLSGGSGQDQFLFGEAPGAADADVILDFASKWDHLRLDGDAFAGIGAAGRFSAGDVRFYAAAGATSGHDADDRIIFNSTTRELFYDADGSGAGAAQLIATLQQSTATVIATDITVEAPSAPPPPSDINGTPGNDSIVGTSGNDTINGLGGNDTLDGGAATDSLFGDDGNDSIVGGYGADYLVGGAGNDTLYGSDSLAASDNGEMDTMDGGLGDDTYYVEPYDSISGDAGGIDTVIARATNWTLNAGFENLTLRGQDLIGIGNALDNVIDASGVRNATLWGFEGNDLLITGSGTNRANGSDGDDTVLGGDGQNTLYGGQGNDRLSTIGQGSLYGEEGTDTLVGGAASDTLDGGTGNDVLTGGAGADVFAYFTAPGAANADVITDFGSDTIQLDGFAFNNTGVSGRFADGDGRFYAAAGATNSHDADDRVIYDTSTGRLYYDSDGSGSSAAQLFATLQGAPALRAADILVINGSSRSDGTPGDDSLVGTAAPDTIFGYAGNDTVDGGAGDDFLSGMEGNDSVSGGTGNDVVSGGEGDDTVLGGAGDDVVSGSYGINTLDGGAGRDTLSGGAQDATDAFLFTVAPSVANADAIANFNSGQDKIRLDASAMPALGGSGNFSPGDARFYAAAGANGGHDADDRVIYNTSTGDLWYDADGNGLGAAQLIAYSVPALSAIDIAVDNGTTPPPPPPPPPSGGQTINGTSGNDSLVGGAENDTINGFAGNDTLIGNAGDDSLDGGSGTDSMVGGLGNDAFVVSTGDVISDAGGIDLVYSPVSWAISGSFENLTFTGTAAVGGSGNSLANRIEGNSAANSLRPREGNDTVTGGGGADSFEFVTAIGPSNVDLITDFASGADKLKLDDAFHAGIGATGNFAAGDGRFWSATGATGGHDANDRVIYDTSSGSLYYDADGSGAGASVLFATLQGNPTLAATDIAVI